MMRTPLFAVALVSAVAWSPGLRARPAGQPPPPSAPGPAAPPPSAPGPAAPPPSAPPAAPAAEQSFDDQVVDSKRPAVPAPVAQTPEDVQAFAAATLDATPLRFAFNAFGDVSFSAERPEEGDESATFSLGSFALLINAELSKALLGTAEVEFDSNRQNEQEVTLERLHLRWQTPSFFVVGGRTHSDLGYWNTAFHHGAWLHLPISRPRALRGEDSGGFLPIHWVGVEAGLTLSDVVAPGTLTIAGGVGNGRGRDETNIPIRQDTNNFKALKLKVEYLGLLWPDLRAGVGGLYDRIAPEPVDVRPAAPGERIDEYIANAYAAYRGVELTLIAEAYAIWHRADGERFRTIDAFAVAGYRFGRLTPYIQIERTDGERADPFYTPVPGVPSPSTPVDQNELLVGARFDPVVWSALKAEYSVVRADHGVRIDHSVTLNWSFGI